MGQVRIWMLSMNFEGKGNVVDEERGKRECLSQ